MTKDEIRNALNREDLWPKVESRLLKEFGDAGAVPMFEWPGPPRARGLAVLNGLRPAAPYVVAVPDVEFDDALKTLDTLAGEPHVPVDPDEMTGATKYLCPISAVLVKLGVWDGWREAVWENDDAATVIHELAHALEHQRYQNLEVKIWLEIFFEFFAEYFAAAFRSVAALEGRIDRFKRSCAGGNARRRLATFGRLLGLAAGSAPSREHEMQQLLVAAGLQPWAEASQPLINSLKSALRVKSLGMEQCKELTSVRQTLISYHLFQPNELD